MLDFNVKFDNAISTRRKMKRLLELLCLLIIILFYLNRCFCEYKVKQFARKNNSIIGKIIKNLIILLWIIS
ncbi:hypothetical protein DXB65_06840 [Bacteroides oleiciplenus]|uniref:Uncharacterized protein n=1 Tax=Bacteroides oleiciplenus TaxID=626931 RepID=A0A3E5BHZ2_9BACE|nr:hypothetical protein DXB65_06840 [Bacteroides oleiciplenus]